jgi:hypothetical protein
MNRWDNKKVIPDLSQIMKRCTKAEAIISALILIFGLLAILWGLWAVYWEVHDSLMQKRKRMATPVDDLRARRQLKDALYKECQRRAETMKFARKL